MNTTAATMSKPDLVGLAPVHLICYRPSRYAGDDISLPLSAFSDEDRLIVIGLYKRLKDLFETLKVYRDAPDTGLVEVSRLIFDQDWPALIGSLQQLGTSSYRLHPSKLLSQVVHDLRGGALTTLLLRIQMIHSGQRRTGSLLPIYFLTRDQLKIMRNGIRDIDSELRLRDQGRQFHSLGLIREKWENTTHYVGSRSVKVHLDMHYEGNVAESCMEFSALDRVIYNLVNNAALYAADDKVDFHVLTVPAGAPQHLRFVIRNRIAPEHGAILEKRLGNRLHELFIGGFTTGGNGFGMRICAEFVANAYGIHSLERALAEGYLGVRIIGDSFLTWFHWPTVAD